MAFPLSCLVLNKAPGVSVEDVLKMEGDLNVVLSAKVGLMRKDGSSAKSANSVCSRCRIVGQAPESTRPSNVVTPRMVQSSRKKHHELGKTWCARYRAQSKGRMRREAVAAPNTRASQPVGAGDLRP